MDRLYNIRAVLAIALMQAAGFLLAAGISLPTVSGEDAPLEPSIQNEVDHALYLGGKWLEDFDRTNAVASAADGPATTNTSPVSANAVQHEVSDLFATNRLDREQIALKLVRSQRNGGFWLDPRDASATNRVTAQFATRLAVSILSSL